MKKLACILCLALIATIAGGIIYAAPNSLPGSKIQQAIDALPPSGGQVVLEARKYLLDIQDGEAYAINIPDNVTLEGQGRATVLKLAPNQPNNTTLINIAASGVSVKDLTLDGNKANQGIGGQFGIEIGHTSPISDILIENVSVHDFAVGLPYGGGNGIFVRGAGNTTDVTITLSHTYRNGNHGISTCDVDGATVSYNWSWENGFSGFFAKSYVATTKNITWSYNHAFRNGTSRDLHHGFYLSGDGFILIGNVMDSNASAGMKLGTPITNFLVIANQFDQNLVAIAVHHGSDGTIANNKIRYTGNPGYGIRLWDGSSGNLVSENSMTVVGGTGTYGVITQDTSDYNVIIDNIISGFATPILTVGANNTVRDNINH